MIVPSLRCFQLILFDLIGKVDLVERIKKHGIRNCFQLILFDLIGKEYPLESLIERGRQTPKSTHLQKGGIGGGKSPDTKG